MSDETVVAGLAEKLHAANLDDAQRALLLSLITGDTGDEVEGFSFRPLGVIEYQDGNDLFMKTKSAQGWIDVLNVDWGIARR
jgi:hypothetical protein